MVMIASGLCTALITLLLISNFLIAPLTRAKEENEILKDKLEAQNDILSLVFQEEFDIERLVLDEVDVSAYSSDKNQCWGDPHETSTGTTVSTNCVATSRDLPIPKGKHILAVSIGTLRNEDTMNQRYEKTIDIWMPDKKAAKAFGRKNKVTIMWLEDKPLN
jgi:3D (Asp-Asp-Asp) domain-containing protein